MQKSLLDPDLHPDEIPNHAIVNIMQKKPAQPWLTSCSKTTAAHCQHHAEKAFWMLTYKLFKPKPFNCQHHIKKGSLTLTYKLLETQSSLVSIMQKWPSGLWLTFCSKTQSSSLSASCRKDFLDPDLQAGVAHCQHHAEKACWNLTHILIAQSILLSASCREGLLDLDLHAVHNAEQPTSVSFREGLLHPDLHPNQISKYSTVNITQRNPAEPWLTTCSKPRAAHCQHLAEKACWTLTDILITTQTILLSASCRKGLLDPDWHSDHNPNHSIVSIMQKMLPGSWLTSWSSTLSASCRKGLLHPDLHSDQIPEQLIVSNMQKGLLVPDLQPVESPEQPIVNIMQKRPSVLWLTFCWKPRATHCQHHVEKAPWPWLTLCSKPRIIHDQCHVVQNLIFTYNMMKVFQHIPNCYQWLLQDYWPLSFSIKHNSDLIDQHYVSPYDVQTNNLFTAYSIDRDNWFCWTERNSSKMASSDRTAAVSFTSTLQSLVAFCISTIYH